MDMDDIRRRCYAPLLTALVFTISGCATAVGQGETALRDGRYADAASKFESALKERPERADALVGLGTARYSQRMYGEAVAHLSQVIRQEPKRADAQLYLGLSYLGQGDQGTAAKHLRAFRDLTQNARVVGQVDDALQLLSAEQHLSPPSRHFIATSLESAVKSEQALRDARSRYARWPRYGYGDEVFCGVGGGGS
jgi:tetratricopeptide (TPR) repeat protein